MGMQSVLRAIYPAACMGCGEMTEEDFALCGACWRDTPFLGGAMCGFCARPLPGEAEPGLVCDACLSAPPPWSQGRAVLRYRDGARRLVLGLKHGDRTDLAAPMALWMARAVADLARNRVCQRLDLQSGDHPNPNPWRLMDTWGVLSGPPLCLEGH